MVVVGVEEDGGEGEDEEEGEGSPFRVVHLGFRVRDQEASGVSGFGVFLDLGRGERSAMLDRKT